MSQIMPSLMERRYQLLNRCSNLTSLERTVSAKSKIGELRAINMNSEVYEWPITLSSATIGFVLWQAVLCFFLLGVLFQLEAQAQGNRINPILRRWRMRSEMTSISEDADYLSGALVLTITLWNRKRNCVNALSVSMVLLETIPGPLGVRVDIMEMKTVPGSPGITADMLEIVLGSPSTKEKVLKTVLAPHDIK